MLAEACRWLGLQVPSQVAILGVDDDPVLCELAYPCLSSNRVPQEQIGFAAAKRLDELLRGPPSPPRVMRIGTASITTRQTTAAPAERDPAVLAALRFIVEQAHRPIRVTDVLHPVGGSRRNLELRFSRARGQTLLDAIQHAHIGLARRLLAETDMNLNRSPRPQVSTAANASPASSANRPAIPPAPP